MNVLELSWTIVYSQIEWNRGYMPSLRFILEAFFYTPNWDDHLWRIYYVKFY